MRRITSSTLLSALALVAVASAAEAGRGWRWKDSGGWGHSGSYQRQYDPSQVATVTGTVARVEEFTPARGMAAGVHLVLTTSDGALDVHLGPSWYVERLDTRLQAGDAIAVTGSRLVLDGKPALIAARVTRGDEELVLRDEQGFPAWAGWRRTPAGPSGRM